MSQLNMNVTPEFERALARLMKVRGIQTKSEAIRVAVEEALESAKGRAKAANYEEWLGLGNRVRPSPRPRFRTDRELWE